MGNISSKNIFVFFITVLSLVLPTASTFAATLQPLVDVNHVQIIEQHKHAVNILWHSHTRSILATVAHPRFRVVIRNAHGKIIQKFSTSANFAHIKKLQPKHTYTVSITGFYGDAVTSKDSLRIRTTQ